MSYLVRCEIICDSCEAAVVMRQTDSATEAEHILGGCLNELEQSGGVSVSGRKRTKHYCRECWEEKKKTP